MASRSGAVRVEGLGKRYRLGSDRAAYRTLRDTVSEAAGRLARRVTRGGGAPGPARTGEWLWALRDASFTVSHGEVVGIVGPNGSGKSTLLKILSRITRPTEGWAEVRGRVGSLLEVGTGFHQELSGRENVFMSGAILGMSRADITRRFDEIVAFAEVERFLETPVKRYSSGMYVRLAFAVAAHLDPEVLIVDEVLAVGDAAFQRKCLGKMGDVARQGRTVLFVSHNMASVVALCGTALFLRGGRIVEHGEVGEVVSSYLESGAVSGGFAGRGRREGQRLWIAGARLEREGRPQTAFRASEPAALRIEVEATEALRGAQIAFELRTDIDECIFSSTSQDHPGVADHVPAGPSVYECPLDLSFLRSGHYRIRLSASIPQLEVLDEVENDVVFTVVDDATPIARLGQGRRGLIVPSLPWRREGE